jgi:hypothetical protein
MDSDSDPESLAEYNFEKVSPARVDADSNSKSDADSDSDSESVPEPNSESVCGSDFKQASDFHPKLVI